MKTLSSLLFLLLLSTSCFARDVTISWDANPPEDNVTEYRVYLEDKAIVGKFDVIATVSDLSAVITIPNGLQTVFVTAFNGLESLPSDSLNIPNKPGKPTNLKITR